MMRVERALSALVLDASIHATVPEYREALEQLQKELGNPWAASDDEKELELPRGNA
jgi:hypothetical protein